MEGIRANILNHMRDNFSRELDSALTVLNSTGKFDILLKYIAFLEKAQRVKNNKESFTEVFQDFKNKVYAGYPKQCIKIVAFLPKYFDKSLDTYIGNLIYTKDIDISVNDALNDIAPDQTYFPLNDKEFSFLIGYIQQILTVRLDNIIRNAKSNEELLGVGNLSSEPTTIERVERFLSPLKEIGSKKRPIVDIPLYENLVKAYVGWIDNEELPKPITRARFYGHNVEFFSVLYNLHKNLYLPVSGIGSVLTRLIAINNSPFSILDSMAASTIEANISRYRNKKAKS